MATISLVLTNVYQLVGAGPGLMTIEDGIRVKFHIGVSLPGVDDPAHTMTRASDRSSMSYSGTENIYAKVAENVKGTATKVSYTAV